MNAAFHNTSMAQKIRSFRESGISLEDVEESSEISVKEELSEIRVKEEEPLIIEDIAESESVSNSVVSSSLSSSNNGCVNVESSISSLLNN